MPMLLGLFCGIPIRSASVIAEAFNDEDLENSHEATTVTLQAKLEHLRCFRLMLRGEYDVYRLFLHLLYLLTSIPCLEFATLHSISGDSFFS